MVIRQKSGSKKTQQITFRIDNLTFEILTLLAKRYDISPHELCRRIILAYLKVKGYIK